MNVTDKCNQVIKWFIDYHLNSKKLLASIQGICESHNESSEWFLYTPLVFTIVNFPRVKFPAEFHKVDPEGNDLTLYFNDSEVYNSLLNTVRSNWEKYPQEDKEVIMFRFSQFHHISDAVRNGVEPEKIVVKSLMII